MSLTRRHALFIVAAALLGALAVLLLGRPPLVAPIPSQPPVAQPNRSEAAVPEADPEFGPNAEWTDVADPFAPHRPPLLRVDGLTDNGALIVGWGRIPMQARNQFNDMAAVFLSRDGRDWQTVPIEHGVNAASTSELAGVAAGPHGFLAYGGVCCDPEARSVWHSTDGATWTRVEITGDLDPLGTYFIGAVGIADGWLIAGSSADGTHGEVWASSDGASWESVLQVDAGLPGFTLSDVAVTDDGVVVVGTVTGPDGTYDGAIWRSPDGRTWERMAANDPALAGEGETRIESVTPFAGGLFATGAHGSTEDREACDQLGMVASTKAMPPVTGLSCGWGTIYHWVSVDGQAWQRIDPADAGGEHPIEFRAVAAGGPGIVVLGESSAPASPDTKLFTSADGRVWTAIQPAQPVGAGVAIDLVVRERQVIAVTDHWNGQTSELRAWVVSLD